MPSLPPRRLPSTFGKQQAGWQALPLLPSFPLTGNSCPASSPRPCQHPPLEYFRGKSENDQQPPKCLFSHIPYMGILGSLGVELPPLGREKMKHKDEDTQSQEATAVTYLPQAATLAHVGPVRFTLTPRFTSVPQPGLVFLKSTHNRHHRSHAPSCQVMNCTSTAHTGQERSHVGQTTRDRSPAPYPEPLPDVPSCGWAHGTQCTSHPVNTLASVPLLHSQPLLKGSITPVSSLLPAWACWVHSILLQLNQSPPP